MMKQQENLNTKTMFLKTLAIAGSIIIVIAVATVAYGQFNFRKNGSIIPKNQPGDESPTSATNSTKEVVEPSKVVLLIQLHAGFSSITGTITNEMALFNNNTYAWKEIQDPRVTSSKEIEYRYKNGNVDSTALGTLLKAILDKSAVTLVDDASMLTVEYIGSDGVRIIKTYPYVSKNTQAGKILLAIDSITSSADFENGQTALCEESGGNWIPENGVSPEHCNWKWE